MPSRTYQSVNAPETAYQEADSRDQAGKIKTVSDFASLKCEKKDRSRSVGWDAMRERYRNVKTNNRIRYAGPPGDFGASSSPDSKTLKTVNRSGKEANRT